MISLEKAQKNLLVLKHGKNYIDTRTLVKNFTSKLDNKWNMSKNGTDKIGGNKIHDSMNLKEKTIVLKPGINKIDVNQNNIKKL